MTQRQVLAKILRKRGYIVLWQSPYHLPFYEGRPISCFGGEGITLSGEFHVVSKTNVADFLKQQKLSRELEPAHWKCPWRRYSSDFRKKVMFTFWKMAKVPRQP